MKKTRKLLALALAMLMAFSLMAVTAAAYDTEEHEHTHVCSEETIQPRIPAVLCPKCRGGMDVVRVYDDMGKTYVDFVCPIDGTRVTRVPW